MKKTHLILLFKFSIVICKNKILEDDYIEEKQDFIYMYKKLFINKNNNELQKVENAENFFKHIKNNEFKEYLKTIERLKQTIKKTQKEIEPSYFNQKNIIIMTLMSCAMIILPIFFCFFSINKKDKKISTKKLLKLKNKLNQNYQNFFKAKKRLYHQIYNYIQNNKNLSLKEKGKFIKLIESIKEKNQVKDLNKVKANLNEKIAKNKKNEL